MKFKYRLLIVFICALFIEITGVCGLVFLEKRNYLGMFLMIFLNPYICLPMNHFNVECKTFKDRFYLATAFACGFGLGVIAVRPFILK